MNFLKTLVKTGELWISAKRRDFLIQHPQLDYLFWECTLNCNFNCSHCGSSAGKGLKSENDLTTEEIKKTFKTIAKDLDSSKIMIAVTGGEPLLRPDLFEVMSEAKRLGFSWGMVTNGSLVTPEIVEKLKASGASSVAVSLDGLEDVHDKLRGFPGAYDKAINAINLLGQANFLTSLEIISTINHKNFFQLEEMYNIFTALPITSWRVTNIDPIGRAEGDKDLLLQGEELKKLLDFIKIKRRQSKIDVTYGCSGFLGLEYEREVRDYYFFCRTGITIASILQNGDIYVCPNVPRRPELIQGNVRQDRFSEVWQNKFKIFRDPNRTSGDECKECEYWFECHGNSYHLWDFNKKQPKFCHLKNKI